MKKFILLVALLGAFSWFSFADDGGSRYPEDWTYGNIYVKDSNDSVSLKNEVLCVKQFNYDKGAQVKAYFDFYNTANEEQKVSCAFPVVVKLPFAYDKDSDYITLYTDFHDWPDKDLWDFILEGRDFTKENVLSLDEKLSVLTYRDYQKRAADSLGKDNPLYKGCSIKLDGKEVSILNVGIETSIASKDYSIELYDDYSDDRPHGYYKADVYELTLKLHFYHELCFKGSAHSKLEASYSIDTKKGGKWGTRYEMVYDISTGGTWKGPIDNFVVMTDSDFKACNSSASFEATDFGNLNHFLNQHVALYSASNYKPRQEEYFSFSCLTLGDDGPVLISNQSSGTSSYVKEVKASSYLNGTYKKADSAKGYYDFFGLNKDENLVDSTYEPAASFDGDVYNGWVEGVKGDGKGEWIEFTLTRDVFGPFATNGLARFVFSDTYGNSLDGEDENEYTVLLKGGEADSTWKSNNRIKTMTLENLSSKERFTLDFKDRKPVTLVEGVEDLTYINAVKNPLFLKKGTYRLYIEDVYKGDRWDDTVLGEVWFVPLGNVLDRIIFGKDSSFFERYIADFIKGYLK